MKMKVFHADTMHEAIRSIKEELGPDALILSTKRVRRGSLPFSLFGRSLLEVTAAVDSMADQAAQDRQATSLVAQDIGPSAVNQRASALAFQDTLNAALHANTPEELEGRTRSNSTTGHAVRTRTGSLRSFPPSHERMPGSAGAPCILVAF